MLLIGDPCAGWKGAPGCEGLALEISIDLTGPAPVLDDATASDLSQIRDQRDVERLLAIAP